MKKIIFLLVLTLLLSNCKSKKIVVSAPKIVTEFFNDGLPAKKSYYGKTATVDSIKTFYKTGKLKEVFFYNKKGNYHGECYQLDESSNLMVTWKFSNGYLKSRTDHNIPSNKNNKSKITKYHEALLKVNKALRQSPNNTKLLFIQAYARNVLGNSLLSLDSSLALIENDNIPIKSKVSLYEILAQVYSTYENENYTIQYKVKAIEFSDKKEDFTTI